MCDNKLSSDEVPKKFAEWLLKMGCPPEKVPTLDKIVEMCRGQYYMVWRSLMEHVQPKDVIRQKRLHVFNDDIKRWKKNNAFNKADSNAVMPEEMVLWHQHTELKEKVASAEQRVAQAKKSLNQLMDKISTKLSHRNLSRRDVQNAQRRAWLLQQVASELGTKKENLQETRSIADSLCSMRSDADIQGKLDKYMACKRSPMSQVASTSLLAAHPVASSSVVSNGDFADNGEDPLSWLAGCRGDALWPGLQARRSAIISELTKIDDSKPATTTVSPQTIVSYTAALHCTLALETLKNKALLKRTRERLAAAVEDFNAYIDEASCQLLVASCERARSSARIDTVRACLEQVAARSGPFSGPFGVQTAGTRRPNAGHLAKLDKAIECKKEDLKRLLISLSTTEKKIYNVRECLINTFNGFHKDVSLNENDKYRGQLDIPQESISALRQFYCERRESRRRRLQLSMDLDASDNCSLTDTENSSPNFGDELRIYLKKFDLNKNRKLILENGEKVWVFETLQAAKEKLYAKWQKSEVTTPMLCPSVRLSHGLQLLLDNLQGKCELQNILEELKRGKDVKFNIDNTLQSKEEEAIVDKIKKRLDDNLLSLQKTTKTLELGQENLKFWERNEMKKYISDTRTVAGKTYKDYESFYIMDLH